MTVALPSRAAAAMKPTASPGLLAGSGAIAATFTATPFVIAQAVERFGVDVGTAALLSTAQVGGFTLSNLIGNRRFRPSARLARGAMATLMIANAVSIVMPAFLGLVAARAVAGGAMGLITWIAWSDSATDGKRRGEIAAVGPLGAAVSAPILGVVSDLAGIPGMYAALTVVAAIGLLAPTTVQDHRISATRQPIATPGVRWVLLFLGMLTCAGSAVFVLVGVLAARLGLSDLALAGALTLNSIAGIPAARFAGRRRAPGVWIGVVGACAWLLTATGTPAIFVGVIALWGLAFWVIVPEIFSILGERSVHPSDRVGDAQATMAFGRVVGPTVGAAVVAAASFETLGIVAALVLVAAGVGVEAVTTAHRWRGPVADE